MENQGYAVYLVYPKGKGRSVRVTSTPLPKFIAEKIAKIGSPSYRGAKFKVRRIPKPRRKR